MRRAGVLRVNNGCGQEKQYEENVILSLDVMDAPSSVTRNLD